MMNIGVVGVGVWGCHSLERELLRTGRCQVRSVYGDESLGANNHTAPEDYARELQAQCVHSLEDILQDPAIQVVSVMTSPKVKGDIILKVLEAGKSFITDKPLAFDLETARKIVEAERCSEGKGAVLVGYHTRPALEHLLTRLQTGSLGKVLAVNVRLNFTGGIYPGFEVSRHWAEDITGGESVTIGSHGIMTAMKLVNSPIETINRLVKNDFYPEYAAVERDDYAVFNLKFQNGAAGNVSVGRLPYRVPNEDIVVEVTTDTHHAELRGTNLTIWPEQEVFEQSFNGADIVTKTMNRFLDSLEKPEVNPYVTCAEALELLK